MKYLIFAFTLILFLVQSSCSVDKCDLPKSVEFAPSVNQKFEGFYFGYFWKCYNQDSSKIDSIWIEHTDSYAFLKNKEKCFVYFREIYKLQGKYIGVGIDELRIEFENFDKNDLFTKVTFKDKTGNILYTISGNNKSSTLDNVNHFDSFRVPNRGDLILNGFIFPQVGTTSTKLSRFWIDPQKGIVQFITQDGLDTFTCLKLAYREH